MQKKLKDTIVKKFYFKKEESIDLGCPKCGFKSLECLKLEEKEDDLSISCQQDEGEFWDCESYFGAFVADLKCSSCGRHYMVCGHSGFVKEIYEDDPSQGLIGIRVYYPLFFHPTYCLFNIDEYPNDFSRILEQAFSLFWNDLDSCANKLRVLLEELMDYNNILKNRSQNLHNRLKEFSQGNSKISELLLALKWIGNKGSHNIGIGRKDVVLAFELLECLLLSSFTASQLCKKQSEMKDKNRN